MSEELSAEAREVLAWVGHGMKGDKVIVTGGVMWELMERGLIQFILTDEGQKVAKELTQ